MDKKLLIEKEKIKTIKKNESKEIFMALIAFGILDLLLIFFLILTSFDNILFHICFLGSALVCVYYAIRGIVTKEIRSKSTLVKKEITPNLFWTIFYGYIILSILLISLLIKSYIN